MKDSLELSAEGEADLLEICDLCGDFFDFQKYFLTSMVIRFTVRGVVTNMLTKLKQNPLFQLAALVFLPGAYICAALIAATNFYYGVPDWLDWGLIWFNAFLGGLVSLGSVLNDVKNWIENE